MSTSRLEKFIYAICSMEVSDLPAPLSRIEILWNCLITGETPDFEPQSRNERYLMAMLGLYELENLPTPMSRGEKLLYKIAMGETDLSDIPAYLSRYEELLGYLAENGGVGDFEYILQTLNQRLSTLYSTKERPMKQVVIKGDTLVNELPRPSLKNTMMNVASQKMNQGYDNGKTLVNIKEGVKEQGSRYIKEFYIPQVQANTDYLIKYNAESSNSSIKNVAIGFLSSVNQWSNHNENGPLNGTIILNSGNNPYCFRLNGKNRSSILTVNSLMIIEYQDGMENWDIPYFEGTKTFSATPNVVDGEFKQAVVKGQTLVNLIDGEKSVDYVTHIKEFYTPSVQANTKYLIIYDANSNNSDVTTLSIGFLKNTQKPAWSNTNENAPLKGKIILDSGSEPYCCRINGKIGGSLLTVNSIMIIKYQEGMENWDIPYFEGMQSVQLSEVTTTGKNLFDKENIVNGIFMLGSLTTQSTNTNLTLGKDNAIKVEPNTSYTFSFATGWQVGALGFNATKTAVTIDTKWQIESYGYTFTTDANTNYMTFNIAKTDGSIIQPSDIDDAKLILEKGSTATPYEPYKSNTLTLAEPVTLRKVGDVEDEFDALTGQVTERVGEVVLDGSEQWSVSSFVSANHYCVYTKLSKSKNIMSLDVICDSLPTKDILSPSKDYEGCLINSTNSSDSPGNLVIKIAKSKLSSESTDGIKEYLSQNPMTLQYQLATESTKTVNTTITDQDGVTQTKLHSFNDGHLSVSSQGLFPSAVNYEVPTNNSYYLPDMLTLGAQYTSRGSADCNATIDGKLLALGKNRTFTTPSSVTNRLMVLDAPVDDLMFIKGDQTAKDFGYFEGMKSVGLVNKMPVLTTTGKNLFDGEIEDGTINIDTGEPQTYRGRSRSKNFIKVPKNTDLYISIENGGSSSWTSVYAYDENKNYLGCIVNTASYSKTFNTENASYIKWKNNASMDTLGNVQIECGTSQTTYEPFKTNILTVNEPVEFRGIGDVRDTLDCLTGEVVERIGEIVLDGSEKWFLNTNSPTNTNLLRFTTNSSLSNAKPVSADSQIHYLTDKFAKHSDWKNMECAWVHYNDGRVNVVIKKDKLISLDTEGFCSWLSQNPITVQYQLETESTKTIDLTTLDQDGQPTKLKTFNDISYVEINADNLIPSVDVEIATKISETLSTLGLEHHDISETQNQLGQTIDEQTENTDATMMATTEIYEQTL